MSARTKSETDSLNAIVTSMVAPFDGSLAVELIVTVGPVLS